MNLLGWMLLGGSAGVLVLLTLRHRSARQWLGFMAMNVILAALILYFINLFGARMAFHIPINLPTVATVGVLGIPGMMLLIALKLTLF
jgi:inhibitor of the pro-sigma K processing machinery